MTNYNSTENHSIGQNNHNDHHHKQVPIRRVSPVPVESSEMPSSSSGELEEQQPLLDPDDPMVSPLNLRNIQILKTVVRILVYLNLLLLVLLVISEFFALPWLTNKGKSFLEIDLVIICLIINSINNLFFVVPAYYERIVGYVISGLLLIDLLVILCVSSVRTRSGFLGIVLIIWTCLNSFLNSIIDYYVEEARHYQEIRYTGRIEKRRTVGELVIMFLKVLVELFLLWLILCISVTLLLQSFDAHEKPWGKLIPVNNSSHRIHLACYGDVYGNSTEPIVLVEGGQSTSSEEFQEWIEELYHLNKLDRFCVWDRPGYGFSDSAPPPVSVGIITEYLTEALAKEDIQGPFSVVAFDIGGLYATLFASKNKHKIHSILFVDSWSIDLLKKWPFSGGNKKNEDPNVFKGSLQLMDNIMGFKLWLRGFVSPLGLITNIHWFFHPMKYSSKSRIFGRDMIYQSKYLRARCQEQLTSGILSWNEVQNADITDIPISVISSDYMIKKSLNWGKWQREVTRLSDKLNEWVIAENSSHFIWRSAVGRKELQQLLLRLIGKQQYQVEP